MTVFLTGLLTCLALSAAIGAQSAFVLRQAIRREHLAAVLAVCIAGDAVLIFAGTAGVGVVTDRAPWLLEVLRWGGAAYLVWFALSSFRSAFTTQRLTVDVSDEPAEPADVSESAALVVPTEVIESPAPEPFAAPREGGVALATRTDARPDTGAWPRITPSVQRTRLRMPRPAPLLRVMLTAFAVSWVNPQAIVDSTVMLGTLAAAFGPDRWAYAAGAVVGSAVWLLALGLGARALAPVLDTPRTWKVIDVAVGCVVLVVAGALVVG